MHGEVPAHLLAHALNGAIVGLAAAAAPQAHGEEAGTSGSAPGWSSGLGLGADGAPGPGDRFRPLERPYGVAGGAQDVGCAGLGLGSGLGAPNTHLECLGVGVVRAVDMAARRVYLLSPLRADDLERVTTLQVTFHKKVVDDTFEEGRCKGSVGSVDVLITCLQWGCWAPVSWKRMSTLQACFPCIDCDNPLLCMCALEG